MKFGYEQLAKTGKSKLSELFDLNPASQQSEEQFRQQIISTVDYYKHLQQKEKQIIKKQEVQNQLKLDDIMFEVISYDENLMKILKDKNINFKQFKVGTQKKAKELLKFNMKNIPDTYIDYYGNIWKIKKGDN